jgi:hypothetical protein
VPDLPSPKQHALKLIGDLPDDTAMEFILYEMYAVTKIRHGVAQADRGELIPHEQVMAEVNDWLHRLEKDPSARLR